ncbi:hypothetical protein, partial [Dickeya parazeae]|uniref:hypothetical protein n=1 Tax=Dickeya parazeae TaxID=2893572 RepID=UPI001AECDFFA
HLFGRIANQHGFFNVCHASSESFARCAPVGIAADLLNSPFYRSACRVHHPNARTAYSNV